MTDHRDNDNYQHADAIAGWIAEREGMVNVHLAQVHATLALTDQIARIADALDVEGTHTSARDRNSDDSDEALVDKADEDSTVRPGLYVGGRRVGAAMGPWEWGADGKWHRTSWTPTPVVQWHYTEPDPDEPLAKVMHDAECAVFKSYTGIRPEPWEGVDGTPRALTLAGARAAREHIDAERSEWDEWYKSGWEAAIGRAENAERERDEAYAAREHFSGHIDYWVEQADEARARAANAEDDRDTWNRRYVNLLDRIRGRRDIYAHPAQAPIFRAETVASELAALLPDEEDDR